MPHSVWKELRGKREEKSHCGIRWSDRSQVCAVWVINRNENIDLQPGTQMKGRTVTQKTPQAYKVNFLNPESIRSRGLGSRSENLEGGGCLHRLCPAVLWDGSWEGEEEGEEEEEQEEEEGRVLNGRLSQLCGFHPPSHLQPHGGANCPLSMTFFLFHPGAWKLWVSKP